jgi:hypothetical protein
MSRISADKAASSREPQGRQPLWEAMLAFEGKPFSVAQIVDALYVNRRTVSSYLACLCAGGYADRQDDPDGPVTYRIVKADPPYHAPRLNRKGEPVTQGAGVENMWRSMRRQGEFQPFEIAAWSSTELVQVSEKTAKTYCSMLLKAGYLRVTKKAVPGTFQATYVLIRNSGPKPPQIQRIKQVFDPNTKTVYPIRGQS